jgi:hypothetical protein
MSQADPVRIATYNSSLSRKGPGLLLRDIQVQKDEQLRNVVAIIQTTRPEVLLLNEFDHDYENLALTAFLDLLAQDTDDRKGIRYPHFYAPPQNVGVPSGFDLDGDGKLGGPGDAFGFGNFRGQYAMALISRYPIDTAAAKEFSTLLWQDIPNADMPKNTHGNPFPNAEAVAVMRLSSKGHWDVPITLPSGDTLHVLASHPTPPVFDGPEDRNGKRNRAEILFWDSYIREQLDPNTDKFVILGDLNADPIDGEGSHDAIQTLINSPHLTDPKPSSNGGVEAAKLQGGSNRNHGSDSAFDTADWRDENGPGNLRVDYVLPSKTLNVKDAGVFWPAPSEDGFEWIGSDGRASSDHRLVWVDLE